MTILFALECILGFISLCVVVLLIKLILSYVWQTYKMASARILNWGDHEIENIIQRGNQIDVKFEIKKYKDDDGFDILSEAISCACDSRRELTKILSDEIESHQGQLILIECLHFDQKDLNAVYKSIKPEDSSRVFIFEKSRKLRLIREGILK